VTKTRLARQLAVACLGEERKEGSKEGTKGGRQGRKEGRKQGRREGGKEGGGGQAYIKSRDGGE